MPYTPGSDMKRFFTHRTRLSVEGRVALKQIQKWLERTGKANWLEVSVIVGGWVGSSA